MCGCNPTTEKDDSRGLTKQKLASFLTVIEPNSTEVNNI